MTSLTPDTGRTQQRDGLQPSPYSFGTTIDAPFEVAVARVTEALKTEGFEVLTTIDVQKTLKEKLNVDFERYTILGACNPDMTYRALLVDHLVGLAMPCTIVIHETHFPPNVARTRIDFADPLAMLSMTNQLAIWELGSEAQAMLQRIVDRLGGSTQRASTHN